MCGIGGVFKLADSGRQQSLDINPLSAMMARLRHRGPDGQKITYFNANFEAQAHHQTPINHALLHARLAIIDTKERAAQPMQDNLANAWLVFNGEIYNWRELRTQLKSYQFNTDSDSEVILAGFNVWGFEKTLERLEGMFAFAILDCKNRMLYLARDRLGKKPLVYHISKANHKSGLFAFASMVNALLPLEKAFPEEQQGINPIGVDAFLAHRTTLPPHTIYKGIKRLAPAEALVLNIDSGAHRVYRYWQPKMGTRLNSNNAASLQEHFNNSVKVRLSSERPVGIFLSGGVDSAMVANAIPKEQRSNILAFTASFDEKEWDESKEANDTAKTLGFRHQLVPIRPNLRDDFSRIVADFDDPFADPSAIPSWYLAKEATKQVKVVLGGDGGDEFFGGYKRYQQHLRWEWLASILGSGLIPQSSGLLQQLFHKKHQWAGTTVDFPRALFPSKLQKAHFEAAFRYQSPMAAYSLRFSGFAPWQRLALYQPDYSCEGWQSAYWQSHNQQELSFPHQTALETLMAMDAENYLPEYILRKGDLASMAHGLEMRHPFLDQNFIAEVLNMPLDLRLQKPPKAALIKTLPESLQHRLLNAKKRGFNPPLRGWIINDLSERLPNLGERIANYCPWINADAVNSCVSVLMSGKNHHPWSGKMPERIFQLLVLDAHLGMETK